MRSSASDLEAVLVAEGSSTAGPRRRQRRRTATFDARACSYAITNSPVASNGGAACRSGSPGTPANSSLLAKEIVSSLDEAIAPLQQVQHEELERRASEAREFGLRVGTRRDVEAQFKREQRRFRLDELRFGFERPHRRLPRATREQS